LVQKQRPFQLIDKAGAPTPQKPLSGTFQGQHPFSASPSHGRWTFASERRRQAQTCIKPKSLLGSGRNGNLTPIFIAKGVTRRLRPFGTPC